MNSSLFSVPSSRSPSSARRRLRVPALVGRSGRATTTARKGVASTSRKCSEERDLATWDGLTEIRRFVQDDDPHLKSMQIPVMRRCPVVFRPVALRSAGFKDKTLWGN